MFDQKIRGRNNMRRYYWAMTAKEARLKAEKEGYRVRNPKEVAMKPKDMPYNGFLPTNKRFK